MSSAIWWRSGRWLSGLTIVGELHFGSGAMLTGYPVQAPGDHNCCEAAASAEFALLFSSVAARLMIARFESGSPWLASLAAEHQNAAASSGIWQLAARSSDSRSASAAVVSNVRTLLWVAAGMGAVQALSVSGLA